MYSFGVLALEVIKGKHLGDCITNLASQNTENLQLVDLFDERLLYPTPEVEAILISIVNLACACLNADAQSRPTMRIVSQMLSSGSPFQQYPGMRFDYAAH